METKSLVLLAPKRREGAARSGSTLSSPFLATGKAEGIHGDLPKGEVH
jgi:hypothetical protein